MDTKQKVMEILKEIKPNVNLEGINDIIDGAYLDSLELMTLISMLTESFEFDMDVDWISPENFNSVDAITALVERAKA